MDIQSKKYRVRSAAGGLIEVTTKASNATAYLPVASVPSVLAMAMMKEQAFDKAISSALAQ